jgi:nucleotide-binding universal stress UspA family protein
MARKTERREKPMFQKILFCTDFSENAHWAFTYALNLAKTYRGTLFILHVKSDPALARADILGAYVSQETLLQIEAAEDEEAKRQITTQYLQRMEGFDAYKVLSRKGVAFYEIIKTAKEESADLIVMGTHGRTGLDHILFGSTAEKVVRKSPCPVLTIRLPGKRFEMP